MHEDGLRETEGFTSKPLEASTQRERFAFNLLGVNFAHRRDGRGEMAVVDSGRIGVEMPQAKRLEQLLQLNTDPIRSAPQRLREDYSRQMGDRMPHPALVGFASHNTPPLLNLRRLHPTDLYGHRVGTASCHDDGIDLGERTRLFFTSPITVLGLICNTRAISRTPLPFRVISIICRFTSGVRPG